KMYPDVEGTKVSGPMYLVIGSPPSSGADITVTIGAFMQTFHLASPGASNPTSFGVSPVPLAVTLGSSAIFQVNQPGSFAPISVDVQSAVAGVAVPSKANGAGPSINVRIQIAATAMLSGGTASIDVSSAQGVHQSVPLRLVATAQPAGRLDLAINE